MSKKSSSSDSDFPAVSITHTLSPEMNRLLTESALRSERTKKAEARLRLADHLERFQSISEIGFVMKSSNKD